MHKLLQALPDYRDSRPMLAALRYFCVIATLATLCGFAGTILSLQAPVITQSTTSFGVLLMLVCAALTWFAYTVLRHYRPEPRLTRWLHPARKQAAIWHIMRRNYYRSLLLFLATYLLVISQPIVSRDAALMTVLAMMVLAPLSAYADMVVRYHNWFYQNPPNHPLV